MPAYYNENDPFAAAWLRELIKAGHIAPGEVDERSIEDVRPSDLDGFTQCHFFAGIGGWSYALRLAGWPHDRPVWTGSCPCQPFSSAGKRKGASDERHLWPSWFYLVEKCRPDTIFGEQVEAAIRQGWFDLVSDDLEGIGYTVGAVPFPACSVGAPHQRQRLYFVGALDYSANSRRQKTREHISGSSLQSARSEQSSRAGFVADPSNVRCVEQWTTAPAEIQGECAERTGQCTQPEHSWELSGRSEGLCGAGGLANPAQQQFDRGGNTGSKGRSEYSNRGELGDTDNTGSQGQFISGISADQRTPWAPGLVNELDTPSMQGLAQWAGREIFDGNSCSEPERSSHNSFWSEAEFIPCRDGKSRPIESVPVEMVDGLSESLGLVRLESYPDRPYKERFGYFPLLTKGKARVGRLRGYGNAIVAPQAATFIKSFLEISEPSEGDNNV